jgi:hypothetical protein
MARRRSSRRRSSSRKKTNWLIWILGGAGVFGLAYKFVPGLSDKLKSFFAPKTPPTV